MNNDSLAILGNQIDQGIMDKYYSLLNYGKENLVQDISFYNSNATTILNVAQPLPGATMNKETYLVVTESMSMIDYSKDLEEAKSKARAHSNKNKCQVFIVKAIWSCAPKTDLVENEY
jgi:hypothetical protein